MLRHGADAYVEADLRAFREQHPGRYKTPKLIRFVAELPRGPLGRVQRLKLLEVVGKAGAGGCMRGFRRLGGMHGESCQSWRAGVGQLPSFTAGRLPAGQ